MRSTLTTLAALALFCGSTFGTTHTVDDSGGADFTAIGEAVAACSDGDTVLVLAGTYTGPQNRGITIDNMNIRIIGVSGYLPTVIDCEGQDRAFYLTGSHDTTTVFRGLSIVNGNSTGTRYTSGGAILMFSGAPALVEDCYFGNNAATDGGAIAIGTGNVARIRGCIFDGNSATVFGGAINCSYDDSVIRACEFTGNTAPEGGAVRVYYSSTAIVDCVFGPGNAATLDGGAIYHRDCAPGSLIHGCAFTGNTAVNGGGIESYFSSPTIEDCHFVSNEVTGEGGGLQAVHGLALTVSACAFDDNSAHHGGGANVIGAPLAMIGCTFTANEAGYWGGALYLASDSVTITDCTFSGNVAGWDGGAARVHGVVSGGFSSCTFSGNSSGGDAGALLWTDGAGSIENSIVAFSTAGAGITLSGSGDPEISHCCVFANAGGDSLPGYHHNNMFVDPLFCGMAGGDYTLCANSFCLPPNNIWFELIGALGQGCAECGSAVNESSWGRIKALHR